jgi:TonB family protein
MPEATLQADLTWSIFQTEDRRFRWILAQTLAVSLLLSVVTARISIPLPNITVERNLPLRRVSLLAAQPAQQRQPAPSPALPQVKTPPAPAAAAPPAAAPPAPRKPALTARQTAQKSGVLAMGDALSELQALAPSGDARPGRTESDTTVDRVRSQSSVLAADVTRGSGGIEPGVAHQSVLGSSSLPQRVGPRQISGSASGSTNGSGVTGQRSVPVSGGAVRGQEQIQELLDRNKKAMYKLYNHELRENPGLQGRLVMSITVSPAGKVTRCVILSSELDSASLEQQLVALVEGIDFGSLPEVPVATTRIPIEFFPR